MAFTFASFVLFAFAAAFVFRAIALSVTVATAAFLCVLGRAMSAATRILVVLATIVFCPSATRFFISYFK